MSDIITEGSGDVLRIQLNRPAKKNALTSDMYIALSYLFNAAANESPHHARARRESDRFAGDENIVATARKRADGATATQQPSGCQRKR